jgi:hypothetical protein
MPVRRLWVRRDEAGWLAGMLMIRAGEAWPRRAVRVPVARVFSLHVVQAGSACPAGRAACPAAFNRAGEKVRVTGEGCPGCITGLVPDGQAGSPSPL